jgi:hypothetical protein
MLTPSPMSALVTSEADRRVPRTPRLVLFQVDRDQAAIGLTNGDASSSKVMHKGRLCAVDFEIESGELRSL